MRLLFVFLFCLSFSALAADMAGEYRGTYAGGDGSHTGKMKLALAKGDGGTWSCKFSFTHDADDTHEVEARANSCVVDGDKVTAAYDIVVDGAAFKVSTEGTLAADNSLSGTYKTFSAAGDPEESGTWKTSPKQ